MPSPLRLGVHSFLNAMPLVWPFLKGQMEHPFEVSFDTPARLSDRLAAGELEVAMVPSVEVVRHPDWRVLPGVAIASNGAVGTVLVVADRPLKEVRRLAVDTKSRTSIVMIEILFRERFGRRPELVPMPDDLESMLAACEAALVIGNTAFAAARLSAEGYMVEDLGRQWYALTHKPFVHAMYAVRGGITLGPAAALLVVAKEAGLTQLEAIARAEGPPIGLRPPEALAYLREKII
ncbi:MAG: menaquinone biosynthetic enzyme MqnA/MqnD family protein, partial [Nitrospinota bacterium]